MSKLLTKALKLFTLYALFVLLASIPAYYYVIDHIWLSELDENNQIVKERIEKGLRKHPVNDAELSKLLESWNAIQPGTLVTPATEAQVRPDSIYTRLHQSVYDKEVNRFRGLSAYIHLNGKPYHIVSEINVEEADETITAIAFVTIAFVVLLVGGFVLLNRILTARLWRPFSNTLDKLKAFDLRNDKAIQFEKTDVLEFNELNNALYKLISGNIATYKQQKEFTENASHELQTPLAILKSKIDLLQQDTTLTNTQAERVNALNIPLSQVSRINKNLLLLAKLENHQYADEEQVNVTTLLNSTVDLLADSFTEKDLTLNCTIEKEVTVTGNKELTGIVLTNLLVNALRHTNAGSHVSINLTTGALTIANDGTGPLKTEALFQRFKTSSSQVPDTGLGLAIIKEICNRYGWHILYTYENNQHIFTCRFS
jgi:signal transduction histidine kinase